MIVLKVTHNAGFFSCCNIRLVEIINFYNEFGRLPDAVDSSTQFHHYKLRKHEDLTDFFFHANDIPITEEVPVLIVSSDREIQYSDYSKFNYDALRPFIQRYFAPSNYVNNIVYNLITKYSIDLSNTCAVFYRGNDKNRETTIASYDEFISKAVQLRDENSKIEFLVQPDETEFLEAFLEVFPDAIHFRETPHMRKKDSVMFAELPEGERADFGATFLAATIVLGKCKHLITHSGNCGMWASLYRDHGNNIHQIYNGEWL